jgi:hypothetical protein
MYYDDQHEEPSDAHDPEFPLPAEMVAAPSAKVSPSAGARNAR